MGHDRPSDRITLSRETLYKYRLFPQGTGDGPEWLLKQINEEIKILSTIAEQNPDLATSLDLLMEAWQDFAHHIKRKAH
ncbi:hypothetical protein GCM10011499_24490 [Pelagibacterium lentulum]|uniref:Uncharacterized protein n=1 Tax=Pelagibacterium lentulum TaxID=2029865 RepID=A0A916REW0_9HYPH|nr:hypothetical protein GCM10011499_24490 [Pelagibacterium lentulum]